ncbi:hypothetical protein [Lichenicoccus sp.]|uniref:hypothetical protein n=1 Tax=Lichenicoccus sp. TaxID=2781899 RepID=UPI003D0ED995
MNPSKPPKLAPPSRAVVVHGLLHATLALQQVGALEQAQGVRVRLMLLSAPAAACFMGAAWWLALIRASAPGMAACGASDCLDCGAAAGRAMEALRLGARHLILSPDCPQFDAVRARAAALDARLDTSRPDALDLAARDADRRLPLWLVP